MLYHKTLRLEWGKELEKREARGTKCKKVGHAGDSHSLSLEEPEIRHFTQTFPSLSGDCQYKLQQFHLSVFNFIHSRDARSQILLKDKISS